MAVEKIVCMYDQYRCPLPPEYLGHRVVYLDAEGDILGQLLELPREAEIHLALPNRLSTKIQERLRGRFEVTLKSLRITQNTVRSFDGVWIRNMIENTAKYRIHESKTIKEIPKVGKRCLVLGNGPSLSLLDPGSIPDDTVVYAAWHSMKNYDGPIDLVMHLDPNPPGDMPQSNFPPGMMVVGLPVTSPQFWSVAQGCSNRYLMCPRNVTQNSIYASATGRQDDEYVSGTVTHGLLQLAIQVGYRDIGLLGVDLCYPSREAAIEYMGREVAFIDLPDGKVTTELFKVYAISFADIARTNKDSVRISNLSPDGISLPGIVRVKLEDWLR